MPGKMTKSILRPPFRPPQVPAAVRSSRLSCGKVGKAQIFTSARESSGESRFNDRGATMTKALLLSRCGCAVGALCINSVRSRLLMSHLVFGVRPTHQRVPAKTGVITSAGTAFSS